MKKFAISAFLLGGAVYVSALLAISRWTEGMVALSAGAVHRSSLDALVPWIVALYFVTSAASVLLAYKRASLKLGALLSHMFLLVLFSGLLLPFGKERWNEHLDKVVTMILAILVLFSPWFVLWGAVLAKAKVRQNTATDTKTSRPE